MNTTAERDIAEHFASVMARRGRDVAYDRFEQAQVISDDIALHVDVIEVAEGAPTVVFVPGTSAYGLIYGDLLDALARQGLNAVSFDARGHGRSGGLEGSYTIGEIVRDARAVVKYARARFGEDLYVAGSSQGGIVALYVAATDERLNGVICHNAADLSDPSNLDLTDHPRVARLLSPLVRAAAKLMPNLGINMQRYFSLLSDGHDDVKARLANDPLSAKVIRLKALASLVYTAPDRPFNEVTTPVLFMHGEQDTMFSRAFMDRLLARLAGPAEMSIYPNHGHFLMTEDGPLVAADMAAWIRGMQADVVAA